MKLQRRFWWMVFLGIGMAIALLLHRPFPTLAQSAQPVPTVPVTELRGVWLTNIDSEVLFSGRNLSRAIDRLSELNFNTLYPTVWNGGYTLYPSSVAERVVGRSLDPYPGLQGRDMLAEALEKGHRNGLAVIPWFEFGLMAPADSDIAHRHPDWITNRQDGSRIVMEGIHPRIWLNPTHPEVQQFLVDLVSEVVARYNVDGLQFDDHLGMPVELGYDPYTVQLYQQDHQGRRPPDDPFDPEWMRWRANKITGLMVKLFFAVKNRNPDCLISLSPNPKEFAYEAYLQDWFAWERQGYIDELIVQVYRSDLDRFIEVLDGQEMQLARSHIPVGIGILTGLRNRPVEIERIQEQVRTVRDRRFAGVSFFFYETLGDRDNDFRALFPRRSDRPYL